jgi:NAD(P)-dependent dehydrogenase (short-subunit alcohol dehydrogenase family)
MSAFDGRVALVTGGGSGIGRASALGFAQEGAAVAVVDIDEHGGAGTVAEIEDSSGRAIFVPADVTRAADAETMVARAVSAFGRSISPTTTPASPGPAPRRPTTARLTGTGSSQST